MKFPALFALCLAGLGTAPVAFAVDVGQHPAVFAPRSLPGVDPNTFVVGHPASPRNRGSHANAEHPAVMQRAQAAAIDGNRFLVQPPAAVRWTVAPVAESRSAAGLAAAASARLRSN